VSGDATGEPVDDPDAALRADRRRLTWGGAAWLFVLAAIGVVQIVRGQWIDAAIFGVTTLLLVAAVLLVPVGTPTRRPGIRRIIAGGAVVAAILGLSTRHGAVAAITMIVAGVAAVLIVWPPVDRPAPEAPWPKALRRLAFAWTVIWIVGCLWELLEFVLGGLIPNGRITHPALSDLLDPIVTPGIGQLAFAMIWVAAGIFLVRRGGRR
jgi:hypothetical protein